MIFLKLIFPVVGILAFILLWIQLMLGVNTWFLRRFFVGVTNLHKKLAIVLFFLITVHPLLFFILNGLPRRLKIDVLFGLLAFFLIIVTVLTSIFRSNNLIKKYWRRLHYLNYLIFILAWFHSWSLGFLIKSTALKYLWIFFGLTALISLSARLWQITNSKK